jgi:hypothetical protein
LVSIGKKTDRSTMSSFTFITSQSRCCAAGKWPA